MDEDRTEDERKEDEAEERDDENLRDLILQQLSTLDPSETSDDDSYKVRLSCILEDDESESSGTAPHRDFPKEVEKGSERTKESEKGPPEVPETAIGAQLSETMYDSEHSDDFACDKVQITDLDDVTLCEKTDDGEKTENDDGFAIKKLKSSDNVLKRPFVVRRRELSSDSSDLDISVTNSAEGPSSDLKIIEVREEDDEENTLNVVRDNVYVESETSADEDFDQRISHPREGDVEVVDNETLSSIFAKVSRTYLEKTKSNVKWEETEKIDKVFKEVMEEMVKARGDQLSFQDVHIRGTSPREYNPPVPPETYLWEELKRLRERGGYPWTYLDKPPFDEATWKKYMEHVYEPINPPPLSTERKDRVGKEKEDREERVQVSSIPEPEKEFPRIPSKTDLAEKPSEEVEEEEEQEENDEGAQELQDRLENRYLTQTPTATSVTTASASRTDVTSSVLDTSEFEEVPAKQGTLVKTRREQMRAHAQEIQQRLRNHAGRIRNKFNNMPRPSLGKKREPGGEKLGFRIPSPEGSRFKFPERPKFHLPDRSKFHLPERPKLNLGERAKIHFPERPKLNLAERAKIHFQERPKLNLAERAKIRFPERGKFHLPDRSKFHFPEKAKFHLPERARFHLPDKSKFHLPERARFNLPNRPKLELPSFKRTAREGQHTPVPGSSTKSRFDFDLKSYPKLFTKHSKDYTTSSPKQTRGRTPPPRMKQDQPKTWTDNAEEIKYADDDLDDVGMRETDSRKSESLFEKDLEYLEDADKVPTLSTKSSASRLSELSDDRKKGVLEEINPDEFFLRQKGISQDDIDMGKYLSREIREAFRSPDVNALAKMDYMDEENLDPRYKAEPKRPKRAGSGKTKSILKKTSTSDPSISDDGYKTYPPRRPGRKSRSQSKSLLNEEAVIEEPRHDDQDVNMSRYDNVEYDEDNVSEYYKTPGSPAKEYQHYKVPRSHAPLTASPSVKRRSSLEDEGSHKRVHEDWNEEIEFQMSEPPKPMARRKNRKKIQELGSETQAEPPVRSGVEEELESAVVPELEQVPQEMREAPEEAVPAPQTVESPVPPKRTRTRSSGSRSLRSFAMEDEVNQSFRSEPGRMRLDELEDQIISEQIQGLEESPLTKSSPGFIHEYEVTDLDDVGFGYATVGKPTVSKPERQKKKKPERPSPPRRKKEISVPIYNTYPRRAPVRPLRNYSTLGPSRPPRQRRIPPVEKVLAERQSRTYAEIKSRHEEPLDAIEVSGSSKDLQTEKVIEKMKGRPLPPPPRPPRQKSKGPEDDLEPTEEEKLSLSILKDEEFPLERQVTAFVHEPPPERDAVEETCASTQTDPLPEDFSFETEEGSDLIHEFSHEQLKIQQAFLEEMKKEEEEMRRKGAEGDMIDAELKAEVIRQIEDIIAEEKRMMERKSERREESGKDPEPKKSGNYLEAEADMGYASLERRKDRQEPPALPPKMEKLQVKELEVGSLNVHEVQSDQIFVRELQSNRIASQEIDNTGGTISLGNMDIPPAFIDQIVAKIPWDALRRTQDTALPSPPVRPQRRPREVQPLDDSEDEAPVLPRKSHRRHHRPPPSTDDDETSTKRSRHPRTDNIPELSIQLARACTSASVQALRSFVQTNASIVQTLDRELCVQAILCIAIALIAGFFLFGFDAQVVHLHHWDFQFPPQPPDA